MDDDYYAARLKVDTMLYSLIKEGYGPNHAIDVFNECIKLLKPFTVKEQEVQHA